MANLVNNLGGPSGFGENTLTSGSPGSDYLSLTTIFPGGLNYFGKTFKGIYIGQNGSVSLMTDESSLSDNVATIYALYADANTSAAPGTASPGGTSTGSNRVYWDFDAVHHRVTITWDDVLPGDPSVKAGNAFQLTLADKSDLTGIKGDFDIILRYESINWLSHDRSHAGIETGYSDHAVSFSRPDIPAALLDLPNQSNVGRPGVFNYEVRNAEATTLECSLEPYGFSGWLDNRDGSGEFSYFNIFEGTGAVTPL